VWRLHFFESFPFLVLDANGGEDSYLYHFSFPQCVMNLCSTCVGRVDKNLLCVAYKTLMSKTFYV
jgi:hypothetical protein